MGYLTEEEFDQLRDFVSDRYAHSGKVDGVVKALDVHNDRVLDHVEAIADGEGLSADERELLRAIAVLHDVSKSDTDLLRHAQAGAEVAAAKLREMGKPETFVEAVYRGIERHMGPFPFVDEEAEKYAERTGEHIHLPRPETKIERLFYDADMLALIDVAGIEKIVVLRSETAEFADEDRATAERDGITPRGAAYLSAVRSMERAAATLHCETARRIADELVKQTREHVDAQLGEERAS